MKRFFVLLMVLGMVLGMCACDSLPDALGGRSSGGSTPEAEEGVITAQDGYAQGFIGDTMRTAFFDFTVNDASVLPEYEGYKPSAGNMLLVVDVTVHNYTTVSLPMFDTDFQAQWSDTTDDAFAVPVTTARSGYPNTGIEPVGAMLPEAYEVGVNRNERGLLVFEVPQGEKDFSLSYLEIFDDDTYGDTFFVFFTPDVKE